MSAQPSSSTDVATPSTATELSPQEELPQKPERDPRYPLSVLYCPVCTFPPELHEYHSRTHFEKCKEWLRKNAPQHFPDLFPDECAARLEALRLAEEQGVSLPPTTSDQQDNNQPKVAVPIEQKTSGGKKKKTPAHIVLALGQRKGKKQVTIVYGLDLFGIKLKDAAKAAKRKFATGSSITISPDNRDVIEIQGSRQQDFAQLAHSEWGVPKDVIFIVNAQKKKVKAFP
ncbi:Translation machinery-associated protein 22 [Gracilariopsis chorda]|uniref:Translation machinery-associated protein 22 n=1 Tax=Gracilariopsis chorda TaxID=448386 RepID=A0A2V3J5N9_9FLOR|nr:Translation machinery-associated protein 22 [Gracilariopsis chorda]|eukprot:PXF49725.1 Translation machinery-associated protein 22 [Gracilariopsis chorda]